MNSNRKQERMEQKSKSNSKVCMECGESHGTLHKVKTKNGKKGYLCEYCFEDYKENNN